MDIKVQVPRVPIPRLPTPPGDALREGWRSAFFTSFWGVPSGPIGWVGARLLPFVARRINVMMAKELDLQHDDDLLDVGCGAGDLLAEATQVRYAAGLDASQIEVGLARARLGDRIAAGTAEVVLGDAGTLPWDEGRFSAVAAQSCLKFLPDPQLALREICRVLRPGGRVLLTVNEPVKDPQLSGTVNVFGEREWSAEGVRRLMEQAGFGDVAVTQLPVKYARLQLVRGVKPV